MKKERLDKFSIRKLTVGAASVLIGVAFGATTVSAAAKPAPQQGTPAGQQAAEVTALKDVKFTFKMGNKSATTEPVTVYVTKDGHYGFENDAAKCKSTAAQIVSAFLDKVTSNDDIKNAQGVAYPEKINAGENTVEVAAKHASNPVEHSDADLQKEAEKKAEELTNSPAFFKAELKDAEHDLQVAKDTVAQAEQEGSLSQEEMAKLQDDVAKAEAKVNELKNSSAFVEVQLKDAEHELEVAKDAVAQAEQEGGLSQEEMGKLQDEVAKAEAEVNELKAKLAKKVTPAPEPVVPAPEPKPEETTYHFQYDDKKGNSIRQDFATTDADTAEMHFIAYASDNALSIDFAHFTYNEATHTFVYKDFESEKGEPEVLPAPAVDVLAEAKKVAHEEFTKAGITGDIFHKAIDAAKTLEGLKAYVAETLAAHKTVEPESTEDTDLYHYTGFSNEDVYTDDTPAPAPVTPTPAPVVSGETGIGYLNLDMLSDGFTGTLYVPVVGKDVNCKVRLLDDAGKYTNDYVVTDTTVKALASKVVNGVTFYKVAENRWIPAKFAEVLSDKEVAFKGVAKTFVKGHANYAVAMLDANGKYTGKFLKQGSSFKVFAKKVINGHLCYRLGTQAQWVPARFLVF